MKKLIALTLCTITAFSMTACGNTSTTAHADTSSITSVINDPVNPGDSSETTADTATTPSTLSSDTTESTEDLVEIPNPFIDCDSLEDAQRIAGFEIRIPDSIESYSDRFIQAVDQYLIQVFYYAPSEISDDTGNTTSSDQILLRKALGTDDISGDYNTYSEEQSLSINNTEVTFKGNDGRLYVITWTDGTYAYAIDSSAGLDIETANTLVTQFQ